MGEIRNEQGVLEGGTPILAYFKGEVVEWFGVRNDPEFKAETETRFQEASAATIRLVAQEGEER